MKKFEVGTFKKFVGAFEARYTIEKVTDKTVTVTIHKGGKYEKTKRCKITDCGNIQYAEFAGMYIQSDDERIA